MGNSERDGYGNWTLSGRVGIALHKKCGDPVAAGEPLATLLMNSIGPEPAAALLAAAYSIGPTPPPARPLVLGEIR